MAKSYDEIVSQMTEDIKSIREASLGVEVREHIASGMENVLEIFKRLAGRCERCDLLRPARLYCPCKSRGRP